MRWILCAVAATTLATPALSQAPALGAASLFPCKAATAKTMTTMNSNASAAQKPRTAASLQCSKDADAKDIHGKPRKAFLSPCKTAAIKT